MTTKTPVRTRETIGVDQFSQRREVFDKHDTVFMPGSPSAAATETVCEQVEPIITSNRGKTTTNFKRNAPTHSSMRETRTDDFIAARPRKYSDNLTSGLNQSNDFDYRYSMTERTRRLSKLRREFLQSNLNQSSSSSPFVRNSVRASMPARNSTNYKIESPNIYKFPFAEPFTTPQTGRKMYLDLGQSETDGKENLDPEKQKHQSLPNGDTNKMDHQKLFEDLVKRYSPQRKPIDWKLPPTMPRVVASVPKIHVEHDVNENNISVQTDNSQLESEENKDQVLELPSKLSHHELTDLSIPALIDKITADGTDIENHQKGNKKLKRKRSFLDKILGRNKDK